MSYKHQYVDDNPYLVYTEDADTEYTPAEDGGDDNEGE